MAGSGRGLAAVVLAAGLCGAAGEDGKAPDFYDAKRAVALVRVKDVSGTVLRTGQGFFLRTGNLVTARHLLEGARAAVVVTASGKEYPAAGVVAEDPATDLALLYTEVPEEERHFLVPATRGARAGEKAWRLSRGPDGKCEPVEVKASRPALFPGMPGVFSAAPAGLAGDAGAPLVNGGLAVLGVVDAWGAHGFVLPADLVRRLDPTGLKTWVKRVEAPSAHGPAFAEAVASFMEGRWEDAAKGFLAMDRPLARVAAAESRRRGGTLEDALSAADEAVKSDGALADAHRVRGAVLLDLKKNADADAAFRRAMELDPRSLDAALGLGIALVRAGKAADAVPVLEKAARLSESDARPLVALAKARYAAGDFGGAYESSENSAARDPESADAREFLGRMQAMAGEMDEAEKSATLLDGLDGDAAKRLREVIERIRKRMKEPPKEKEKKE